MGSIKHLPLGVIETEGLQIRVKMDQDVILDYAEAMKAGKKFPPLLVFFDGTTYFLADGFHRLSAARELKAIKIACDVQDGTRLDARLAACGANKEHGLRRSPADKRNAVKAVLEMHPEWSSRMVAEHVGVEHHLVASVRQVGDSPTSNVINPRQLRDFGPPPAPPKRVGADGKFYPATGTRPPVPVKPSAPLTAASEPTARRESTPVEAGEADTGGESTPAGPVDSLGRHVPVDLAPLWQRRQEVQEILTAVSRVRSTIRRAQETEDPLWAETNFSAVLAQLDRVYSEVDATKPYVVCPMCQGIGCRACRGRGLLGKYRYDTVVPRELKVKPQAGGGQ